ncbi:hypothetical protein C4D60_Mb10t05320 [Musa balbisiana]|uniref:Thioredoxin domain-containing protein n=1 Tax=Musa balbisiana TaxID=52838 RepID=A0A4S8IUT6_MUSBA|nr:hypothetical protein C4D60_Mb10t05320 [Musa balbisiana]
MAISLRYGSYFYGDYQVGTERKEIGVGSVEVLGGKNEFKGRQIVVKNQSSSAGWNPKGHSHCSIHGQASICLPRAMKWWEKSIIPNMTEITSSDHLVESLATAGDKLVIVDFYSPGCGGCKALHPKLAESYPDAIFLKVNYEEHKSMCHSLRIHVLPFFRLYRGALGRVCSFSCTNATVRQSVPSHINLSRLSLLLSHTHGQEAQRRNGEAWDRAKQSWTSEGLGRGRASRVGFEQGSSV